MDSGAGAGTSDTLCDIVAVSEAMMPGEACR